MSNPSIIIDPNEARDIEKNLILREIYYRPTGYFSNAKTLRDEYSVSSSNHDPLGLHPLALPELLTEILSYLAEDKTFIPDFIFSSGTLYRIRGLCPNLRHLTISNCHGFSSKTIGKIIYPNLLFLKFYNNAIKASKPHHIKDKTICGIASLCPNLTYLYLGYSNNISDISVIEIAKSCKKIEYINIGGSGITDVSLKEIAHLCPNLRHLHLSNCEKITDDGICAIAISHPNMLSFSFADEEGKFDMDNIAVSDTSVRIIADSCPKLQYLNVSWRHISDESICVIAQLCPELEQLYLEGCDITDKSMSALANLCNLQKLVIADCDEISMNAIITLQNKNPTLNIFGWYSDTNSESDTDGVIQKADPVEKFVLNIDEYVNPERLTH
ncbi:7824_t:CDS:2 [Entrophospora sp. SA101]|nr:7824_t:CDS:2 [Entrophospora sp. SA101]